MPRPIKVCRPAARRSRPGAMADLGGLLNLGPKSSAWLTAAGIRSRDELTRLGPIEACRRIRAAGHPVSVLLAYAIEGGLQGVPWNALPSETKVVLRTEFAAMQRAQPRGPRE